MAIKLLTVTFLLAAAIMAPINAHFVGLPGLGDDQPTNSTSILGDGGAYWIDGKGHKKKKFEADTSYLWSYMVFTYVFTALTLYFIVTETKKIIRVRQDYLGSQSTITDRTIRLSGIPPELRSDEHIARIIEKLQIGKVESVTLCRNWGEIDNLMDERAYTLRKLEQAWTAHLGDIDAKRNPNPLRVPEEEPSTEMGEEEDANEQEHDNLIRGSNNHDIASEKPRPTMRIWYGFLKLQSRKVDAIDYYEEKLRQLDEKIKAARKKEYKPSALAFVTMDSVPACQMAVQALIDPRPMQLLASLAPAPSDIVWPNTYLPRSNRMVRSWLISTFITILSIIWSIPIAPFASLLSLCSIKKVWPELGNFLGRHQISKALVQTGLPTLVVSLLNIAVPYLYDYLSNMQGMISQSEVELSVISKNFFFTFFNVFFIFTAFSAASNLWGLWDQIEDSLTDTRKLSYTLANSVKALGHFYANFILLQGVGLFPLRLLEFGSVSLYPIYKMSAKTPRDYTELAQPPIFKYGFYLPTSILILILCIVYSVLPAGYQVLFFGLIYFVIGYFTYKYQLLYAMDNPQHATGKGWTMICYRIMLGLAVFQLTMAGVIALKEAFTPAALVVPLLGFTIWFSYFYGQTYEPLTRFIALRSIRREGDPDVNIAGENIGISRPPGHIRRLSSTVDEEREKGQKYVNPSLVIP
jgi:calcium permeable stress-gated cation channel